MRIGEKEIVSFVSELKPGLVEFAKLYKNPIPEGRLLRLVKRIG